ncbi:MAG: LysM peptidoglycan-binding domain-containing protein [Victivallaceae bacterium]|nr:LysM peptidoglycan-binding domain-containing protein [Victivallaceae bacterium]
MKTKSIAIVAGVSFLHIIILAGIGFTGGCKSTEILSPKGYIPAPAEEIPTAEPELKIDYTVTEQPPIEVKAPPAAPPAEELPLTFEPVKTDAIKYTVKRGDSFWLIGKKYGVSQQELAAYNKMSLKKTLKIGQVLNIPPGGKLQSAAELKASLKKARKVTKKRRPVRRSTPIARQPIPTSGTYIVKSGDNPWTIARKFRVNTNDLLGANGLNRSSVLKIGQKLVIPGQSSTPTAVIPSTTASSVPVPSTIEDANKTTDDILNSVDDPATPTEAKPATETKTTIETIENKTTVIDDSPIIGADTVTLDADTTIEKFADAYKVKVEDLERLNPDLPKDGKLKANTLILMPSK